MAFMLALENEQDSFSDGMFIGSAGDIDILLLFGFTQEEKRILRFFLLSKPGGRFLEGADFEMTIRLVSEAPNSLSQWHIQHLIPSGVDKISLPSDDCGRTIEGRMEAANYLWKKIGK